MGLLGCQKMVLESPFGLPYGYLNVSKEVDETTAWWRRLHRDFQVLRQPYGDSSTSSPSDTVEGDSGKDKTIHGSEEKDNADGNSDGDSTDEEVGDFGSGDSDGEGGGGDGDEEGSEDEFALDEDEDTEEEDEDTEADEDSDVDEEEDLDAASIQELMRLAKEEIKKKVSSSDTTDGKTDSGGAVVNISGEKSISVTTATEKRKIEEADDDDISSASSSADVNAKKQKLDE